MVIVGVNLFRHMPIDDMSQNVRESLRCNVHVTFIENIVPVNSCQVFDNALMVGFTKIVKNRTDRLRQANLVIME